MSMTCTGENCPLDFAKGNGVRRCTAHHCKDRTPPRSSHRLEIGDTIQCADEDDMINTMKKLAKVGVDTEFFYERDGQKGLWLAVIGLDEE